MELKHTHFRSIRGQQTERVSVMWRGYGFDREFDTMDEAKAYIQGLRDAQNAVLVNWSNDTTD